MPQFFHLLGAITLLVTLILSGSTSRAHLPIDTNIAIDIELNDSLLVIEPWAPTFLLPPLEDVIFNNQDDWPSLETRRAQIENFFDEICPVEIDGVHIKPKLQKLRLQPMEQAKHVGEIVDFVQARVVLHYQAEAAPETMKLHWGIFPSVPEGGWGELVDADQNPQEFDMMIFVDNKEDYVIFSPEEPEFLWVRRAAEVTRLNVIIPDELEPGNGTTGAGDVGSKRLPIASILAGAAGLIFFVGAGFAKVKLPLRIGGLAIAATLAFFLILKSAVPATKDHGITEVQSVEVFRKLQANLYSAFDFETEDEVYGVLEQSVDGALLEDVYSEVYRSLIVEDRGRALCKVQKVEVLETDSDAVDPGEDGKAERFDIACHWRVYGIVKHFEHIHRRVNEYRADYRLTHRDTGWKITGVAVSQQDRLDPKTLEKSADY